MSLTNKPPKTLQAEGIALWKWMAERFEISGLEPLLEQLCQTQDRLAAVRAQSRKGPPDGRLVNSETKLLSQYVRIWKLLGLSDDDAKKNRVGRPPSFMRSA
jgi:hypothetical protein